MNSSRSSKLTFIMSKAMLILLAVAAVLAVTTRATEIQLCGSGAADTTSVQLADCNAARCQLTRGAQISLTIRFTPTTTINSLTTDVTAEMQGEQRPLVGINGENACNNIFRASDNTAVSCPLSAGVQYIYRREGTPSSSYPAMDSRLHWGLQQSGTTVYCFEKDIRLI